jgi:hypothetical protein
VTEAPKGAGGPFTEPSEPITDAGDVVEGEVGSARFKDPTRVEAEGVRADRDTLPGQSGDEAGAPGEA